MKRHHLCGKTEKHQQLSFLVTKLSHPFCILRLRVDTTFNCASHSLLSPMWFCSVVRFHGVAACTAGSPNAADSHAEGLPPQTPPQNSALVPHWERGRREARRLVPILNRPHSVLLYFALFYFLSPNCFSCLSVREEIGGLMHL